jgi:hypothetical protein
MDSSIPNSYEKLCNAVMVVSKSQFMLSDWLSSTAEGEGGGGGGGGVIMNVGKSDPGLLDAGTLEGLADVGGGGCGAILSDNTMSDDMHPSYSSR